VNFTRERNGMCEVKANQHKHDCVHFENRIECEWFDLSLIRFARSHTGFSQGDEAQARLTVELSEPP
jgi:hypothetical protein